MTPKNDAVAAGRIRKAGHGPGAAQHFPEGPLDHVGGAHVDAVGLRDREEVQQLVQIAFHAGHRARAALPPAPDERRQR